MRAEAAPSAAGAWVRAFFNHVAEFSRDYLERVNCPPLSVNGGGGLNPRGLVLHHTTDASATSVVHWLCDPRSRASAHFVIAEKQLITEPNIRSSAAPAYALPASIVQLRPLTDMAWHATWANTWSFGVEICNGGELRHDLDGLPHSYRGERGWQPTAGPSVSNALRAGGRAFCGFSDAQLHSLNQLLFALCWRFGLTPPDILGHDHVQGVATVGAGGHDKRDMSPGFDMGAVRQRLFGTSAQEFWRAYYDDSALLCGEPTYDTQRGFRPIRGISQADWELRCRARGGELAACASLLGELGYAFEDAAAPLATGDFTPQQLTHVRIFQRMMGLEVDGVIGPLTRAAISRRHADRLSAPAAVRTGEISG